YGKKEEQLKRDVTSPDFCQRARCRATSPPRPAADMQTSGGKLRKNLVQMRFDVIPVSWIDFERDLQFVGIREIVVFLCWLRARSEDQILKLLSVEAGECRIEIRKIL